MGAVVADTAPATEAVVVDSNNNHVEVGDNCTVAEAVDKT